MKIGWIKISSQKYGSLIYGNKVKEVLAKNFDLEEITVSNKIFKRGYLRAPELFFNLIQQKGEKDLWIREFYPTIILPFSRTKGKNLVIVHHIDFSQAQGLAKIFDSILEKFFYKGLKRADFIVTISSFWQEHFLKKGYNSVYKIYNGFNLKDFDIPEVEVEEFKKKHNLVGKPIIYLGNCQPAKGVFESYQALKNLNCHLVTSGRKYIDIPVKNLNLQYSDYLKLLKVSSIVLFMTKMREGWGRTAHEAMLLQTPVIGSGLGGTRELLEGGKQIICSDFADLKQKTDFLLNNPTKREKIGKEGYNFAKDFTAERFEKDWLNLIKSLTAVS